MWWSYSDCHKCGYKSSSALSRRPRFIRSGTNHCVKHNSEEVIKLFISHLSICLIFGEQDRNPPQCQCAVCATVLKVILTAKVTARWSFSTSCPFKLLFLTVWNCQNLSHEMSSRRPATLNWAVQAWDDEEPNWKFFRQYCEGKNIQPMLFKWKQYCVKS